METQRRHSTELRSANWIHAVTNPGLDQPIAPRAGKLKTSMRCSLLIIIATALPIAAAINTLKSAVTKVTLDSSLKGTSCRCCVCIRPHSRTPFIQGLPPLSRRAAALISPGFNLSIDGVAGGFAVIAAGCLQSRCHITDTASCRLLPLPPRILDPSSTDSPPILHPAS